MAKQTFTAGQVLTATQVNALQANDYNQTVSTKTASYVLVAADVGTRIVMNSATDATITVNASLFAAGDTLWIHDIGAGSCTIVAGTCTVTTSSTLVIPTNGGGYLYFTSASSAIFFATGNIDTTQALSNRNLLINGSMQVDQRNSGSSYTMANATYGLDRWGGYSSAASKYSVQRLTTTPPAGFAYYQRVTSLAATADIAGGYYVLYQVIEGFNSSKLSWGTASAKSISLSFWVRSSLTGTFGGGLRNAGSGGFYSYAFTYTINAANTWEYKTISITGSTAGTWGSSNDIGINIFFDLGTNSDNTQAAGSWANVNKLGANGCVRLVGTNAATLDFTGVQFEQGAVATPFESEDYGTTLAKCQRYYYRNSAVNSGGLYNIFGIGQADSTTNVEGYIAFPVAMRTAPSSIDVTATASNYAFYGATVVSALTSVPVFASANSSIYAQGVSFRSTGAATVGRAYQLLANNNNTAYIGFSAEL